MLKYILLVQKQNRVKISYCTENKMIPRISYAEVQCDLRAPLKHATAISKVQVHKDNILLPPETKR